MSACYEIKQTRRHKSRRQSGGSSKQCAVCTEQFDENLPNYACTMCNHDCRENHPFVCENCMRAWMQSKYEHKCPYCNVPCASHLKYGDVVSVYCPDRTNRPGVIVPIPDSKTYVFEYFCPSAESYSYQEIERFYLMRVKEILREHNQQPDGSLEIAGKTFWFVSFSDPSANLIKNPFYPQFDFTAFIEDRYIEKMSI